MELITTNESADEILEIENCLHTYFYVGDIGAVSLTGLQDRPFRDFAAGATGARKLENDPVLRITKETNRVYPDTTGTVEIRDEKLQTDDPRGEIQFPFDRRLESVDHAEIAGRLRPGGTPANDLCGIRQCEAEQAFGCTGPNRGAEGDSQQQPVDRTVII